MDNRLSPYAWEASLPTRKPLEQRRIAFTNLSGFAGRDPDLANNWPLGALVPVHINFGGLLPPMHLTRCKNPLGATLARTTTRFNLLAAAIDERAKAVFVTAEVPAMTAVLRGNVPCGIAASLSTSADWGQGLRPHLTNAGQNNKYMSKTSKTKNGDAVATGSENASVTNNATAKAGHEKEQKATAEAAKTESKDQVKFTAEDKVLLEKHEAVIAANVGAFLAMGKALSEIKSRDLQKATDAELTFDEYCSKKWGFGKAYAYRLIGAYECVKHLETSLAPKGVEVFPSNEAQVRPLTGIEPKKQTKAWTAVLKKADGGLITAAMVEEVVGSLGGKSTASEGGAESKAAPVSSEHKTLEAIAKLVEKAKQIDPEELNLKKFKEIIETIEKLLKGSQD